MGGSLTSSAASIKASVIGGGRACRACSAGAPAIEKAKTVDRHIFQEEMGSVCSLPGHHFA